MFVIIGCVCAFVCLYFWLLLRKAVPYILVSQERLRTIAVRQHSYETPEGWSVLATIGNTISGSSGSIVSGTMVPLTVPSWVPLMGWLLSSKEIREHTHVDTARTAVSMSADSSETPAG